MDSGSWVDSSLLRCPNICANKSVLNAPKNVENTRYPATQLKPWAHSVAIHLTFSVILCPLLFEKTLKVALVAKYCEQQLRSTIMQMYEVVDTHRA